MTDRDPARPPTSSHHPTAGPGPSRRRVIALAGGMGVVSLAGCLGALDGGGSAPEEPVDPADDAACGVCKMKPAKFPGWNAQLVFGDGTRVHFCSPGCFVAFYADPGRFLEGRRQADISAAWVTDQASGDWTDAMAASFVLETNAVRIDAPMMKNPVPFASRTDATAYVDQYDDLGSADIVGIEAFDVALAKQYRGRFFE